jgi:ATP-dependent DNA helicase RecQ
LIRDEHKQLSVYGIGKESSKEEWIHYIKELIQNDYIYQTETEYPVLKLTAKSKDVLFNKLKVYLSAPLQVVITKEPVIHQQHPYEKELFDELKNLRNKIAHQENVPAYIIFSDSTLLDLATYLPLIQGDLLKISGFGTYKAERYGHHFLQAVQDYCKAYNLQTRINLKQPKRERKESTASANQRPSNTMRISYELFKTGKSIADIASQRGLSINTIETHLSYYISTGVLLIDDFVDYKKQKLIRQAAALHGINSLKNLKETLPEEISYGDIRMVLAVQNIF